MVGRIFDNLEMLMGSQEDMPQARKAAAEMKKRLGSAYMECEPEITGALAEFERQGFIRGFRMAVSLFTDI